MKDQHKQTLLEQKSKVLEAKQTKEWVDRSKYEEDIRAAYEQSIARLDEQNNSLKESYRRVLRDNRCLGDEKISLLELIRNCQNHLNSIKLNLKENQRELFQFQLQVVSQNLSIESQVHEHEILENENTKL